MENSKLITLRFYSFIERHPKFKQEYEWTLDKIARRKELGMDHYKLHPLMVRMMPRYYDLVPPIKREEEEK